MSATEDILDGLRRPPGGIRTRIVEEYALPEWPLPTVSLLIKRLAHAGDLPMPAYESAGAAGLDLRAASDFELMPRHSICVPTGFAVAIPAGYEGTIRPRSGLANRMAITVTNSPGTIDSDYRGELMVMLTNHGFQRAEIRRGDRIAQLVLSPVVRAHRVDILEEGMEDLPPTDRGEKGFGSTGMK